MNKAKENAEMVLAGIKRNHEKKEATSINILKRQITMSTKPRR